MKFLLNILLIFPISYSLNAAMGPKPLNSIEKSLVIREISIHGIEALSKKIHPIQPTKGTHLSKPPFTLTIIAIFSKTNADPDILTRTIFEEIEKRESVTGYMPKKLHIPNDPHRTKVNYTNCLGDHTRYYWEDIEKKNVVDVVAKISNKKAVEEIIAQERTALFNAIKNYSNRDKFQ